MDITWHVKRLRPRQMVAISLALAAILAASILIRWRTQGTIVPLGPEFTSGTLIRVGGLDNSPDADAIALAAEELLATDFEVRVTVDRATGKFGLDMETQKDLSDNEEAQIEEMLSRQFDIDGSFSAEWAGPAITSIQGEKAWQAMIGAFVAIAVVAMIASKNIFASGAIVLCIGLNILGAIGGMAIFSVPLSIASVAGMLMLLGYSIDTNILLTTKVLKRFGGEARDRIAEAMRTGLTMTSAVLIALFATNILITAPELHQLSMVFVFGLLVNVINTWFLNAGMLLWHVERRRVREYYVSE